MLRLNKRQFLQGAGMTVAAASWGFPARSASDVIKVGVIQPQQGDCAQWGIPITRGVQSVGRGTVSRQRLRGR
ncbi:hypothetical protein [Rhizobium sp. 28DA2]|uniref:hypothetical protein n=1 Tax=Rhizobium sp. 28DA2 TaxID=3035209 RepID=UPI002B24BBFA|nr:hypothetical protein [Rhizobium sp. 28DA2]